MLESRILEKRDRREGMNGIGRYASKLNPYLALMCLSAGSSCRMRSLHHNNV